MNIDQLIRNLESKSDPKQAELVKKYMKSELEFYGLKIPMIRKLVSDFLKYNKGISIKQLYPDLEKLWKSHVFEQMAAALFILEKFEKIFDGLTGSGRKKTRNPGPLVLKLSVMNRSVPRWKTACAWNRHYRESMASKSRDRCCRLNSIVWHEPPGRLIACRNSLMHWVMIPPP